MSVPRWPQVVAAAALVYVLVFALVELPHAFNRLNARHRTDSHYPTYQATEAFEQSEVAVIPDFVTFVKQHVPPGDTFYVTTGTSVTTNAPQAWLQYELVPSVELYDPCAAAWIVFYATSPAEQHVEVSRLATWQPGYSLGRRSVACTR